MNCLKRPLNSFFGCYVWSIMCLLLCNIVIASRCHIILFIVKQPHKQKYFNMASNNLVKFWSLFVIISVLLCTITEICLAFSNQEDFKDAHVLLEEQEWIHGAKDCRTQSDLPMQIVKYDRNTWILRQSKCVHYEAPFMYLLMGKHKALLIDTGATEDEILMPLYDTVIDLLKSDNKSPLPLIVAHSHSHADHYAGDGQFKEKVDASVVGLEVEDVKTFFNINNWPEGTSILDLGERLVEIFAIPGHDEASLAFYDNASRLLITGDTFYPGRLYVSDWASFKQSISKLYDFATKHEISYIVGTHIEMSKTPGVDYPVGSTYHPEEQKLPLTVNDLGLLNDALQKTSNTSERIEFDKFVVVPK